MIIIRKRNLSRVTSLYFRPKYGEKLSKVMTETFNAEKQDVSDFSNSTKKTKSKKSKKSKIIKKSKPGFRFLFNKDIYVPFSFAKKRISVYNGKFFFSFIVKLKYVYTRLAEFVSTKKFGRDIHKKPEKKKGTVSKKGLKK